MEASIGWCFVKPKQSEPIYVAGGYYTHGPSPFGEQLRAVRIDGETRTTFCEDYHEFNFELNRTLAWLRGELDNE